jgi:hypothetical protein
MKRPPGLYLQVANGNMILQLSPRYWPPIDNTMVMSIFHKTTDGSVSVLMDDEQAMVFAKWAAEGRDLLKAGQAAAWELPNGQTTARAVWFKTAEEIDVSEGAQITRIPGLYGAALLITISWNGSGRYRSITLDEEMAAELAMWIYNARHGQRDREGWPGWLDPYTMPMHAHGHVWVSGKHYQSGEEGFLRPCRICERIKNWQAGTAVADAIKEYEDHKGE